MKITKRQLRRLIKEAMHDELSGVTPSTDNPLQGMRVRDFIDYLGEFDDLAPIFVSRAHGGDHPAYPSIVDGFVGLSAGRFSEDATEVGEDAAQAVMIIHPDFKSPASTSDIPEDDVDWDADRWNRQDQVLDQVENEDPEDW